MSETVAFAISFRSAVAMPCWLSRSVPHMYTRRVTVSRLLPRRVVYLSRAFFDTVSSRAVFPPDEEDDGKVCAVWDEPRDSESRDSIEPLPETREEREPEEEEEVPLPEIREEREPEEEEEEEEPLSPPRRLLRS